MASVRVILLVTVLLAMMATASGAYVEKNEDDVKMEDSDVASPPFSLDDFERDAGIPVFIPDFSDSEDIEEPQYYFPTPLKRRLYNDRYDIFKRSKLNRLIQRLMQMKGDRYSYHRASPVRFAAGRR